MIFGNAAIQAIFIYRHVNTLIRKQPKKNCSSLNQTKSPSDKNAKTIR
jgi:hypothetical protein